MRKLKFDHERNVYDSTLFCDAPDCETSLVYEIEPTPTLLIIDIQNMSTSHFKAKGWKMGKLCPTIRESNDGPIKSTSLGDLCPECGEKYHGDKKT